MADDEQPDLSAFDSPQGDSNATAGGDSGAEGGADGSVGDETEHDAVRGADRASPADTDPNGGPYDGADEGEDAVAPPAEPDARPRIADLGRVERVELGVTLLAHLERESLPLPDAVDRIETITTNPSLTRKILDTADRRGIIDREDGRICVRRGGTFVRFDEAVVRRRGDYECRRCGADLDTGHFVQFAAGELGPFGPECVRRVLGRS